MTANLVWRNRDVEFRKDLDSLRAYSTHCGNPRWLCADSPLSYGGFKPIGSGQRDFAR
jgi:hypothetical protein